MYLCGRNALGDPLNIETAMLSKQQCAVTDSVLVANHPVFKEID